MGSSVHCPVHLHTGPGPTVYTALSASIIYRAKVQDYLNLIRYASYKLKLCILTYIICCCFLFLAVSLMYSFALHEFYWSKINVILLLLPPPVFHMF